MLRTAASRLARLRATQNSPSPLGRRLRHIQLPRLDRLAAYGARLVRLDYVHGTSSLVALAYENCGADGSSATRGEAPAGTTGGGTLELP
jgi:hypothetical protein